MTARLDGTARASSRKQGNHLANHRSSGEDPSARQVEHDRDIYIVLEDPDNPRTARSRCREHRHDLICVSWFPLLVILVPVLSCDSGFLRDRGYVDGAPRVPRLASQRPAPVFALRIALNQMVPALFVPDQPSARRLEP